MAIYRNRSVRTKLYETKHKRVSILRQQNQAQTAERRCNNSNNEFRIVQQ